MHREHVLVSLYFSSIECDGVRCEGVFGRVEGLLGFTIPAYVRGGTEHCKALCVPGDVPKPIAWVFSEWLYVHFCVNVLAGKLPEYVCV